MKEEITIQFVYDSVVKIDKIQSGKQPAEKNLWVRRFSSGQFLADDFVGFPGKRTSKNINGSQIKKM